MYCNNCGFELKEDATFCTNCGAKVEAEEILETAAETEVLEENVAPETPVVPEAPKKKKGKFPKALVAVAAVVVVLVGGFFAFKDAIMGRMMFLLPAETQMKAAFKDASKDWGKQSGEFVTDVSAIEVSEEGTVSGTLAVSIGDAAKKELESAADIDLGNINKVFIDYEGCYKENQLLYDISVGLGKTEIMTVNMVMDMERGVMALTVPELSDEAIELNMEDDLDMDTEEFAAAMESSDEVMKLMNDVLPSAELLEDMVPRYIAVMIQAIDEVERDKDTIDIGDVSQKATSLTVELDDGMMKDIGEAVAEELKEDEAFEDYLKKAVKTIIEYQGGELSNSDWKDGYDELLDGVEEMFDALAEEEVFQDGIEIVTWVNSKNEIIGLEVADAVEILGVKDGKQVAKHILVKDPSSNEKLAEVRAEGKEEKEVFSGDVTLEVQGEEVLEVKVSKYQWTDDKFELTASVVITNEMLEEMIGEENPYGDTTLKVDIASSKNSASIALTGLINDKEWIVIECSGKNASGKAKISYPSDVVSIDDIDEWMANLNSEKIVDNLDKAGVLELFDVSKDEVVEGFDEVIDYYADEYFNDDYYDYYDYDDYYDYYY